MLLAASDAGQRASACWQRNSCCAPTIAARFAFARRGAGPTSPQPALTEPKPQDTAERRQVTVMFSDLVGSTALSARMDPEDLREVISAYQKCVAETVGRFGGFVAKYMGDGVLIYFGYGRLGLNQPSDQGCRLLMWWTVPAPDNELR